MPVTIVAVAIAAFVMMVVTGLYFLRMTPAKAAVMSSRPGGRKVDLAQLHRTGKIVMINAPILLVLILAAGYFAGSGR